MQFKNDGDKVAFYNAIKEIDEQLDIIDSAKEQMKNIIDSINSALDLPKPHIRKVARLYHKRAGAEFEAETDEIKQLYNTLKTN